MAAGTSEIDELFGTIGDRKKEKAAEEERAREEAEVRAPAPYCATISTRRHARVSKSESGNVYCSAFVP
jgi:hypothetical protein